MLKPLVGFITALAVFQSCNNGTQKPAEQQNPAGLTAEEEKNALEQAQTFFAALPVVAESPANPITPEKVKLGKLLYFDARLSAKGNNSCNSCHKLESFGVDNLPTSPGDEGKNGDRNSPTAFNAALHAFQFWDGRAKDVEEQAGMPILNPGEMNIPSKEFLEKRLKGVELYKTQFASAFPEEKNPVTYDNLMKAIGAFERTLITPSRFDEYVNGKTDALTADEKKGMIEFINAGCTTCHSGATFGGMLFQKFGLLADFRPHTGSTEKDEGKKAITGSETDKDFFKVPGLRNITKTHPYFHDGSVADLDRAITIMAKVQLNKDLSPAQVASIKTFLQTLEADIPADVKQMPAELAPM